MPKGIYIRSQENLEHLERIKGNEFSNLAIACFSCNRKKGPRPLKEFLKQLI